MDILPELIEVILNYVCDTRAYSAVSKLAHKQAAARPDHATWQYIRSLNDYFVYGSAEIVAWALANIPEFANLDSHGLVCALANAVRADNIGAISVLILLVPEPLIAKAAKFCGPKTYKIFSGLSSEYAVQTRCPLELGFNFDNLDVVDRANVIRNRGLTDEYLTAMLGDNYHPHTFITAFCLNRVKFSVAMIKKYGPRVMQNVNWEHMNPNLKLLTILADIDHDTDYTEILTNMRSRAIENGDAHELDSPEDARCAAENLRSILDCANPMLGKKHAVVIGRYCLDDDINRILLVANSHHIYLWAALAERGRTSLLDKINDAGIRFGGGFYRHINSLRWAVANKYLFKAEWFADSTIESYLEWRRLTSY